jgi:hypothetical protein
MVIFDDGRRDPAPGTGGMGRLPGARGGATAGAGAIKHDRLAPLPAAPVTRIRADRSALVQPILAQATPDAVHVGCAKVAFQWNHVLTAEPSIANAIPGTITVFLG